MNRKKLAVLFMFFLILAHPVSSRTITFGSVATGEEQKMIFKGEQDVFKTFFLNLGDQRITVNVGAVHSSDLRIEVDPVNLTLTGFRTMSPSDYPDKDWFVLSDGKTYAELVPVYIHVRVPAMVSKNLYDIKVTAIASIPEDNPGNGIKQSLSQSREMHFQVYVPGDVQSKSETEIVETTGTSRTVVVTTTISRWSSSSGIASNPSTDSASPSMFQAVKDFITGRTQSGQEEIVTREPAQITTSLTVRANQGQTTATTGETINAGDELQVIQEQDAPEEDEQGGSLIVYSVFALIIGVLLWRLVK